MEEDDTSCGIILYCDEDPFDDDSTPIPPPAASYGDVDDVQQLVDLAMEYKARERCYAPMGSAAYIHRLLHDHHQHGGVSSARTKAVHYIIYAFSRLGLAAATVINAVNYLDRFLSINCHLSWEVWMVELVSVACLSIACKLDEVTIPSLHDLQMEEAMSHSFRASTIRDMELTLLKALQWRLACVTPYSYLDLLPFSTTAAVKRSRCIRFLLRSLSEPSFLRFDASVVAAAALRCVAVLQDHAYLITPPLRQLGDESDECFKMMKSLETSLDHHHHYHHKYSAADQLQGSPISVIAFEGSDRDSTVNSSLKERQKGVIISDSDIDWKSLPF
ncbi:putative cyclin-D7-1 [Hordeum vulgare subsp. vulgare]|uniref:putative cyclin-D7-1 n=1 Tax=Hordeum vulgare subsp. vulgare TaxID=112509 RepID=UPI001D1A437F|nr:putative cyclin-D7-1 [Hordeum vulgare subsp. vulgare]